jgi:hypothetical protein
LTDILARLGGDLLSPDMTCETDADCNHTLISPHCDELRSTCTPCADAVQQAQFGVHLGLCLASAGATCCQDPAAEPDCIVRACMIGCGAQ